MGTELLRRSSSMLPSYHRTSSTGVELEPLNGRLSVLEGAEVINGGDTNDVASIDSSSPSCYYNIRDLLFSLCLFMAGWWGPKFTTLPSEDYLRHRPIPYQVLSNNDTVIDFALDNPLVNPQTVPSRSLIFISIWTPIIVMSLMGLTSQRSYHEVIVGISSLLLGVGCSEGSTQLLKHWVLRRRPNFYQLCGFDMATRHCEGEYHEVLEAQLSFPSGHSSLSWCGMIVLVWFLLRRRPIRHGGKLYLFVCAVVPLAFATFVACSRIADHWHHVSDVLTGVFIGCLCGTIGFHVHHSSPSVDVDTLSSTSSSSCLGATKLPSSHE